MRNKLSGFYLFSISLIFIVFHSVELRANNVSVQNVKLTDFNISQGFTNIQFDLSWENAWKTGLGPANHDAVWIFIKYRTNGGVWQHCWLNNNGHFLPGIITADVGLKSEGLPFNELTNPGIGIIIQLRTNVNADTVVANNIKIRWNYRANNVPDNALVDVQVFAVEMVFVPQGTFAVGGGSSAFTATTIDTTDATINPGNTGSIVGEGGGYPTNAQAPNSAAFPNGVKGFYSMKYEVSQSQYMDFLNSLTRDQQDFRCSAFHINSYMSDGDNVLAPVLNNCNSIRVIADANGSAPRVFGCDLNNNGIANESNDGQYKACNFISYLDLSAVLDWMGLRPMTELEFEKMCRGKDQPLVSGEYAWGNATASNVSSLLNDATTSEMSASSSSNANYNGTFGPMRSGSFGTSALIKDRVHTGSSFYGIMDLSGNVAEHCISLNDEGLNFTGTNGDGNISSTGFANELTWPSNPQGSGVLLRGGDWQSGSAIMRVSRRTVPANYTYNLRTMLVGGRGVRSIP